MSSTTKAINSNESRYARVAGWLYRNRDKLILLLKTLFIVSLSILTITKPIYEWDLLAYMGNAMGVAQNVSPSDLHATVYQAIKTGVPPDDYARLIGSPSRLILSKDPEAFSQTLAFFYDARIIYIRIMSTLLELGFKPVFAFYFFSTLCVILSYLLLSRLIPVAIPMGMHIVLPFITMAFGLMYVARLATPDALAALCTIGLYFLLFRNRMYCLLLLLPVLIFVRSDLILLTGLFYLYFLGTNRAPKILVLLSLITTIAAYGVLNYFLIEADPWSSLIGYNFGEKPTHPSDYNFPITVTDYMGYLWQGILSFSYAPMVFVFAVFSISGTILLTMRYVKASGNINMSQLQRDLLFLFLSGIAYFILHFLLFPVSWLRFFAAQYTLAATVVCWCLFSLHSMQHRDPRKGLGFLRQT